MAPWANRMSRRQLEEQLYLYQTMGPGYVPAALYKGGGKGGGVMFNMGPNPNPVSPPQHPNRGPGGGKKQGPKCTNCGETNHQKEDCKHLGKACENCGRTNHHRKICHAPGGPLHKENRNGGNAENANRQQPQAGKGGGKGDGKQAGPKQQNPKQDKKDKKPEVPQIQCMVCDKWNSKELHNCWQCGDLINHDLVDEQENSPEVDAGSEEDTKLPPRQVNLKERIDVEDNTLRDTEEDAKLQEKREYHHNSIK